MQFHAHEEENSLQAGGLCSWKIESYRKQKGVQSYVGGRAGGRKSVVGVWEGRLGADREGRAKECGSSTDVGV